MNYKWGPPIPRDSVQVASNIVVPDFASFITKKISSGYSAITSNDIAKSSALAPLVLGDKTNGIYYAGANNDLNVPNGLPGRLEIHGTVYILVSGLVNFSKDIDIVAGDANAALVMIADNPGNPGTNGFLMSKVANTNAIPLVMMTNSDVTFLKFGDLASTSIFGRVVKLARGQYFSYDHAKLDPFLANLINSPGGIPIHETTGRGTVTRQPSTYAELRYPRF